MGYVFAMFLAHFPKKGISNYIAPGSIVQVFMVYSNSKGMDLSTIRTHRTGIYLGG